jgi:dynein heavy chain 2
MVQRSPKVLEAPSAAAGTAAATDPISSFVALEVEKAYGLCKRVDACLGGLSKVFEGSGMLTPVIQAQALALLDTELPAEWSMIWEGPESPLPWLRTLVKCTVEIQGWRTKVMGGGGVTSLLAEPLNLSNIFQPDTFLNALRQQTARASGVSVDSLKLSSSWGEGGGAAGRSALPIRLQGLLLQGSRFDNGKLAGALAETPPLLGLPVASIGWVPNEDAAAGGGGGGGGAAGGAYDGAVSVPVYFTPSRQKLLTEFRVPHGGAGEDESEWVNAGVAIFLAGDAI